MRIRGIRFLTVIFSSYFLSAYIVTTIRKTTVLQIGLFFPFEHTNGLFYLRLPLTCS